MNEQLKANCDLLVKNRDIMEDAFSWTTFDLTVLSCAGMYTGEGKAADPKALARCREILKDNTGVFSSFRGHVMQPLIAKMALHDDPEAYFKKVETIYRKLNESKWFGNEYQIMAAMAIADHVGADDPTPYIEKTETLLKGMKENHPWLTSDEDIPFAAMLAVSGIDTDALLVEMEKDYALLKETFPDSEAVQTLSHVLSLDAAPAEEKCRKVTEIYEKLKEEGHKFGKHYELAVLGALNMLPLSAEEIAALIIEADDYLEEQRGFGSFTLGSKQRRMYAAQMVADTFREGPAKSGYFDVLGSTLAYTICLEICLVIIISWSLSSSSGS